MELEFSTHLSEKSSNIFHENPSSGKRTASRGRTHMTKLSVAFRSYANAPEKKNTRWQFLWMRVIHEETACVCANNTSRYWNATASPVVSIVTRIRGSIPGSSTYFYLSETSRPAASHPASYPVDTGSSLPEATRPWRKTDHKHTQVSIPPSAVVSRS